MISKKVPAVLSFLIFTAIFSGCLEGKLIPDPETIDYKQVYIGDSLIRGGRWLNEGHVDAVINGLVVESSPVFTTTTADPKETVPENDRSSLFQFVFTPNSTGEVTGTATILASGVRPKKMKLVGEGVYLKAGKYITLTDGDLVKDEPLNFKEVIAGKTKTLTFTIKNSFDLRAVTLKPSFSKKSGAFAVTNPAGDITVPAKGELKVTVTFSPSEVKDYSDILELKDGDNPFNLSGTVVSGKGVKLG